MRGNSESDFYYLYTTDDIDFLLLFRNFYMTDNREEKIKEQIRGEQYEIYTYNTPQTYKGNLLSLLGKIPKRIYGYIRKNKVIKRY
jgi:hypothetical protein